MCLQTLRMVFHPRLGASDSLCRLTCHKMVPVAEAKQQTLPGLRGKVGCCRARSALCLHERRVCLGEQPLLLGILSGQHHGMLLIFHM